MRKSVFLFVLVFLCFSTPVIKAQQSVTDSLVQWLGINPEPDTNRVNNLISISNRLYRGYPDSARVYAKEARYLATDLGFQKGEAAAYRVIGYTHGVQGRSDSALYHFDLALELFEILNDNRNIASLNAAKAADYARMDKFELALQSFLEAANYFNKTGNYHAEGVMYNNTGSVFLEQELYIEAQEYFELALTTLTEPEHERSLTLVFSNLATVMQRTGNLEQALTYVERGIENSEKYDQRIRKPNLYLNQGKIFRKLGDLESALSSFNTALEHSDRSRNQKRYVEILFDIASIEFRLGDFSSAEAKLEEVIATTREQDFKLNQLLPDALTLLALTEQALGNHNAGLVHSLKAKTIADSLHSEEMALRVSELETIYETEKKEAQIQLLEIENEVANLRILIISIVATITIIFVLSGFWWYHRTKAEQRKRKMEGMKTELQKFGLVISEKNNFISQFKEELDEVRRHVRTLEGRKELTNLVDSIHRNINLTEDENELFNKIDQVNAGFYVELRQRSESLTEKDERLATLIQMDLTTKDIANILHIEPDSVKRAKNRLKKKLQLDGETDLGEYLKGLAA